MGTRFKGDTKDPMVNVTTWCLLVVTIFSVLSRLGTKFRLFRQLIADDLLMIASLVFGVGQSIAVSLAVGSGYGKHLKDVTSADLDQIMKQIYAASLLYILSLLFSKLSLVVFIRKLTPSCEKKRVARGVEAIIYAWATVAFFGSAFSCVAPRTFDFWRGDCFNLLAWHYFIGISNIVTEVSIFIQATIVMLIIRPWGLRLVFAGIFVPRIFVIATTLVQLLFTKSGMQSDDWSYNMCELTIFDGIVQCLSIVTACWPQLKPFLSWMRSNGLKIQDVEDHVYQNYKMSPPSQTGSTFPDQKFDVHESLPLTRQDQIIFTTNWEVDSQSSQANIVSERNHHPWADNSGNGGQRSISSIN
ncbi:hypothetical protein N7476_000302 [Penicillium atrosanguineum]|uniref:Rhodopsin domain-containing protein n=1 Tax=Penicillium atrosanguineum TaxID=1132637 RepID=A0A9W9QCP2_9EURO|nr:hypothetical protein N7476_000302 [Penicillium atrosanguineum]